MKRLRYSVTAEAHLRAIYDYSVERWGIAQAERYRDAIMAAAERLRRMPELGMARPEIADGVRGIRSGAHIVFYRLNADTVTVVAVLHCASDIERAADAIESGEWGSDRRSDDRDAGR